MSAGVGVDVKLKGLDLFSFAQIEVKIIESQGFKEYVREMTELANRSIAKREKIGLSE